MNQHSCHSFMSMHKEYCAKCRLPCLATGPIFGAKKTTEVTVVKPDSDKDAENVPLLDGASTISVQMNQRFKFLTGISETDSREGVVLLDEAIANMNLNTHAFDKVMHTYISGLLQYNTVAKATAPLARNVLPLVRIIVAANGGAMLTAAVGHFKEIYIDSIFDLAKYVVYRSCSDIMMCMYCEGLTIEDAMGRERQIAKHFLEAYNALSVETYLKRFDVDLNSDVVHYLSFKFAGIRMEVAKLLEHIISAIKQMRELKAMNK